MPLSDQTFIDAIVADPTNDAPRLVYADWLEENDRSERAEFIRIQIELTQLAADDPAREPLESRESDLLKEYERIWTPPDRLALFFEWERGFVKTLNPCARGVFRGESSLEVLAEYPLAEELVFGFCMGDEEFQYMPELPSLKRFGVTGNVRIADRSFARIGDWKGLESLVLQCEELTDDSLPLIGGLSKLRELDLSYSSITSRGLRYLAGFERLESLDLSETSVLGEGLDSLALLPRLRRLRLQNCGDWEHGIHELAASRSLEELWLQVIYLDRPLGDQDLASLARIAGLRRLRLDAAWHEVSDGFFEELRRNSCEVELDGPPRDFFEWTWS